MMMDKKTLLENGLLEQYLLGELNANECDQIEKLLASDAQLRAQFDQLEQDFETIGLENAITPPPFVKTECSKSCCLIKRAAYQNVFRNSGKYRCIINDR